ncbi:PAS domain S-box-containing protein [Hymenobacter luteus]|uniref:histidine kinase n=2 Tax=Hymenobacter TaxID=89966 RepID=A0A7W9WDV8_9BACT|nr:MULTISPECIES: PAS domain S-box protein [Hymenobacter]MBB4603091.1 PAS domain S-box-containing protein [Hymenobacter latericoloratus]MBB6060950.1 PAS domain S-box-containing protein [Hymenobacter luteus]
MSESENEPTPGTSRTEAAMRELRLRAERRQRVTSSLPPGTPATVQQLVQELQVHQIELEMQYEELLTAQAEMESSRNQYADLYEFAPVGYCTLTPQGEIEQLNLRASQLLGVPRQHAVGRRLAVYVAPHFRAELATYLEALTQLTQPPPVFVQLLTAPHAPQQVRLEGTLAAGPTPAGPPSLRLALIDVTEQHQARLALERSEQRFRILFERNQDGMLLLRDNHFLDCNEAALRLLGLRTKEDLLGRHAAAFSPEKQPNGQFSMLQANAYWDETLRRGFCRFEWCRLRSTGEEFWEDILLTTILDPKSDTPLVLATWRDITQEKQAAIRIRENEDRLRMALSASETGVWTIDYATDQVYWDLRSQTIFGRPFDPRPTPFQVVRDAIHPADLACVTEALQRSAREQAPFDLEHRIVWPDGTVRHVSAVGKIVQSTPGQPGRFVGLMRDITQRREAEEELNYKTQLLEHILVHLPVILSRLAADGTCLEVVGHGLRRLHVQDNELVGRSVFEVFPSLTEPTRRLLAGEQVAFLDVAALGGQTLYYQNYGFFDAQRQQAVLFAIDVTEAEQGRVQLQAEKEFTQSLLNNTVDCVVALDTDLRITAWNARMVALAGVPEAAALGRFFAEAHPSLGLIPEVVARVRQALAGEASALLNWTGPSGTLTLDLNFVPLRHQEAVTGVLVVGRDVTERNHMLAEATRLKLRQQQEVLSAILTTQEEERRRISESLHNGVGQLLYATRLTLDTLPPSEQLRTCQQLLSDAIRSTRAISFELTPSILEDFGLELALRELVKRIPPQALTIDLNLSGLEAALPRPLETTVYRSVQELLNNVIKHAQAREVFVQVAREDGMLHVSVEDDGVGVEDTSEAGPGNGIGLAGIRTRVGLLGGTFTLQSRPGRGTSITLTFPVTG